MPKADQKYSKKESESRFLAALRGAFGKTKKKASKDSAPAKAKSPKK